jgi:two-component system, NtrC family, sensor histidine kinase KinB
MSQELPEIQATRASLELLYHVSRELASNLDLRTVLERVLFLAMRYTKAIRGSIIVMDDQGRPLESAMIAGGQIMDRSTQRLRSILDHGLAGWVVRNTQPALVFDTSQDERWMFLTYEQMSEKVEAKSAVSAPLMVRDQLVGVITLIHPKPNFFSNEHLSLVQTIADQAGIAVLNARLYTESQRQVRVMTALAETAAAITASLNLEDVFLRILDQIMTALSVQAACLALVEVETNDEMVVRAAKGWANIQPSKAIISVGKGIAGWVALEGRPLIVNDVLNNERYDSETQNRTGLHIQAIACAPLKYRTQVIGILEAINPTDGSFDSDALLLLTGIGSLAGTAVRHAQLFERLQAAHQSYRELFDDSIDLILITDWNGSIIEANRKAILSSGYNKETLRSMTIQQLHTFDQDLVGEQFEKLSSESTAQYESRLRTQSGYEIPVQVHTRQVLIEGNQLVQWILRDITDIKNLDNLREDLTSMIYHDLRSPLANIVSSLEIIGTLIPDEDETIPSLVSIALRSTERIQRLTNSLLDISRLEAGQPVGNRQPCQSGSILRDAYELVKPIAESKQQHINLILPEPLPIIDADADMIRRVIVNLLENASKYSPSESMLQLGAKEDGEWLQVWVQDEGPGIPASEHERIFTKFTRLSARESIAKGLGLGLAYCRLAVEAHQGHIWVESEPGMGSRFIFRLPTFTSQDAFLANY